MPRPGRAAASIVYGVGGGVGVTAGASAPEVLVDEVLDRLRTRFDLKIEEVVVARENITFKLPAALKD